jgi:hypothetical protein
MQIYLDGNAVGGNPAWQAGSGGGVPQYMVSTSYIATTTPGIHTLNIRCTGAGSSQGINYINIVASEMY